MIAEPSGDLALIGSGDPSLSGRVIPYDKSARTLPPLAAIDNLADQVVSRGVQRINGNVIGDDRLYPWDPFPPSWTIDDTGYEYGAPVSALSLNENIVTLSIRPAQQAGEPATLSLSPALELFTIDNRVITSARGTRAELHLQRIANSSAGGFSQWRVSGTIPLKSSVHTELLPVDDPALFAAAALYDALVRRGVAITGVPVARHRSAGDAYIPATGQELAARTSPPLSDLLQVMNKISHNLYAELFLREVARAAGRDGATAAGAKELSAYLAQLGAPLTDFHLDDGSGLSRNALVTPRLLTHVLAEKANGADRENWIALLPVGGEDGTLEKRLCCVSEGRGIRAKTGSLDRVASLSGYANSKTYGLLAFAILLNDFAGRETEARGGIDKIAKELLE